MNRSLRFRVLLRDKFTCQYCGRRAPDVVLEIDHLHPRSRGGPDRMVNLLTACRDCNQGKRDSILPDELVERLRPADVPTPPRKRRAPKRSVARRHFKRVDRPRRQLPVALGITYVGPDEPAERWICAVCGFTNWLEHEQCSCDQPAPRMESCRECGQSVPAQEWDDYRGFCISCYEEWRSAMCWDCDENERAYGEDYCRSCLDVRATAT